MYVFFFGNIMKSARSQSGSDFEAWASSVHLNLIPCGCVSSFAHLILIKNRFFGLLPALVYIFFPSICPKMYATTLRTVEFYCCWNGFSGRSGLRICGAAAAAAWHIYLVFIIFLIYSVANGHAYLCL